MVLSVLPDQQGQYFFAAYSVGCLCYFRLFVSGIGFYKELVCATYGCPAFAQCVHHIVEHQLSVPIIID